MIKKQAKIKSYLVTKITKKLDFWHHNIKNERTHYLFQVSIYIRQLSRLYCILYHQFLKISPKKDHGTNLSRMTHWARMEPKKWLSYRTWYERAPTFRGGGGGGKRGGAHILQGIMQSKLFLKSLKFKQKYFIFVQILYDATSS